MVGFIRWWCVRLSGCAVDTDVLAGELAAVQSDLEGFAAEVFESFAGVDQRRWGGVYLRGPLLDGQCKSVEPMAARLAWKMAAVVKPTALIVDGAGFLKDGDASACVARRYTGTAGKVTNCQAGVSLRLVSDTASAAADW